MPMAAEDIEGMMPEESWMAVLPCLIEFFYSNDYSQGETEDQFVRWNAVTEFLEDNKDLSPQDICAIPGAHNDRGCASRIRPAL